MKHDSWVHPVVPFLCAFAMLSFPACGLTEYSEDLSDAEPPVHESGPVVRPPVKPASRPPAPPSSPAQSGGGFVNRPGPYRISLSSRRELTPDWVVRAGDQIVIRPSYIEREQRKVPEAAVSRTDHSVCVKQEDVCIADEPILQSQCKRECHFCQKCNLVVFCSESLCCKNICTNIEIGRRCVRTERRCAEKQNQWQEQTLYGPLGPITRERTTSPMKDLPALMLSGLKLKVVFPGEPGKESGVICSLAQYQPKVDPDRVTVTLRDGPECAAGFAAHPNQAVQFILINEMSELISYRQGIQIKTWEGKVLSQATEQTYSPDIHFEGAMSLVREVAGQ